jgi:hypothetical protein
MALANSYYLLVLMGILAAVFIIQPVETATVEDYLEGKNAECYDAQKLVDTVVYVKNTEMARDALQRALDDDLMPICVKSGGHSYTCNFAKPGCFQIDLSLMNSVEISNEGGEGDNTRYFATMGPGALARGETYIPVLYGPLSDLVQNFANRQPCLLFLTSVSTINTQI